MPDMPCGGIFLATQIPFMDLIFPKRLANTLLLKIFRPGNFRM